nr:c-mos protein [Sinohyriopsis cumingii]
MVAKNALSNNVRKHVVRTPHRKQLSSKVKEFLSRHCKLGMVRSLFVPSNWRVIAGGRELSDKQRIQSQSNIQGHKHENSDGNCEHFTVQANYRNAVNECKETIQNVNKQDYKLGKIIGSGGFGSVYLAQYNDKQVAVKVMHKVTKNPAAQLESFKAELHVMHFHHPHIVQILAVTPVEEFDSGGWIVMEYIGNMSLQGLIDDHTVSMNEHRRLKYAIQIADALAYAHKNSIAHMDLKPANILITPHDDCKLGDFGCSHILECDTGTVSPTERSVLTGTYAYRAPELLRGEAPTSRADIFSYGITLWQMLSRKTPYSGENQHVVIFGVVAYGTRPKHPEGLESNPFELCYMDLYSQCWNARAGDRPSAIEVYQLLNIWKEYM